MYLSLYARKTRYLRSFFQLSVSDTFSYHALFTLDHQAFVLVHATDATDDIVVFVVGPKSIPTVMVVAMVPLQWIRAVGLAGSLAYNLVNLDSSFMTSAVVGFPQPAHIPAYRWLPTVIFLVVKEES